jgi:hypothetical protein
MTHRRGARVLVVLCFAAASVAHADSPAEASAQPAQPFDLDGNGVADLVIGAPGEDIGSIRNAGDVTVLLSGPGGLGGATRWSQNTRGIGGAAEAHDAFGQALTSGDFDRDGYADVAVGAPGESLGGAAQAGAVTVLYGSPAGLSTRDQFWSQSTPGVPGGSEWADGWGAALAAGDLDGDGYADLAVGSPLEDIGSVLDAGAVTVLYGSPVGLTAARSTMWHQDTPGIADAPDDVVHNGIGETRGRDSFGAALAIGDTTGDGLAELIIGVPNESLREGSEGAVLQVGALHVLLGRADGITADGSSFWSQDSPGVLDESEPRIDVHGEPAAVGDAFGSALAVGDVDGDGLADVAVGVPREAVGADTETLEPDHAVPPTDLEGAVAVLRGSPDGLTAEGNQFLHQDTPRVPGLPRGNDQFGAAVALGDVNLDGLADLVVGVPGDDNTDDTTEAISQGWGGVTLMFGHATGFGASGVVYWSQRSRGVPGSAEPSDNFGASVALLPFGRGDWRDLAIGVPGENSGSGVVQVLYDPGYGSVVAAQTVSQDSAGIPGRSEPGDGFAIVGPQG